MEIIYFSLGLIVLICTIILSLFGIFSSNIIASLILFFSDIYLFDGKLGILLLSTLFIISIAIEFLDFFAGPLGAKLGGTNKKALKIAIVFSVISFILSLVTFQFYIIPIVFIVFLVLGEIYYNKEWSFYKILKSVLSVCLTKAISWGLKIVVNFIILFYYFFGYF